jgi:hypothetical protein
MRGLEGYEEEDDAGMPFSLSLLILPLSLHRDTRDLIGKKTRSYLLKIVANHPQMLVDFGHRTSNLMPFTLEALGLLMHLNTFRVTEDGRLQTTDNRVRKSLSGTAESVACQRVARFLGREFARIGDRATIYTTLGVRP